MVVATRERPVRAVIIDDTRDIRDLLSTVLARSGVDVVGQAGDGQAGVDLVRAERPDVVLLDLAMPVMDGVEALPIIRALVPEARIIVLSAFTGAVREQVLEGGADGYLVKGTPLRNIVAYVEASLAD
jgi:two-component system, chemotaxis family, chemotaxis protein CheY